MSEQDEYVKANKEMYDTFAKQFKLACENKPIRNRKDRDWQKELKKRMWLLDIRLKVAGVEE